MQSNARQAVFSPSNLQLEDPLQARERFAVKLRTSRRKQVINAKRLKLTKKKAIFLQKMDPLASRETILK